MIARVPLALSMASGLVSWSCFDFAAASRCTHATEPCPAECAPCSPAGGAIAFVQGTGSHDDSAAQTVSVSLSSPTQVGDLIVVAASWGDDSALDFMPTATDSAGDTYVLATRAYEAVDRQSLATFYAANVGGGAIDVTVHFNAPGYPDPNGAESYRHMVVAEYSGVSGAAPLITKSENVFTMGCTNFSSMFPCTTGAFAVTSGQVETSVPGPLIVGVEMNSSGHYSDRASGGDFKVRADDDINQPALDLQDRVLSSTGAIASTQTWQINANYIACALAFAPRQ
jgi:hypothetical protein